MLRKSEENILYRLKSIDYDRKYVCKIKRHFGSPSFANLRAGIWYLDNAETVYFKSTDGHQHNWDFSTSRLNMNLLERLGESRCCIVVDSTRKGKKFPDSFSKTIPIWCAVLNRTARIIGKKSCPEDPRDIELNLPEWVPAEEKMMIEENLDNWVQKLMVRWNGNFNREYSSICFLTAVPKQKLAEFGSRLKPRRKTCRKADSMRMDERRIRSRRSYEFRKRNVEPIPRPRLAVRQRSNLSYKEPRMELCPRGC